MEVFSQDSPTIVKTVVAGEEVGALTKNFLFRSGFL